MQSGTGNPNPNPSPNPNPKPNQVLDDISCTTSEMNTNLVPGLQDVLGLVPPSPDFNEFRRGLPMGLKRIPSEATIALT